MGKFCELSQQSTVASSLSTIFHRLLSIAIYSLDNTCLNKDLIKHELLHCCYRHETNHVHLASRSRYTAIILKAKFFQITAMKLTNESERLEMQILEDEKKDTEEAAGQSVSVPTIHYDHEPRSRLVLARSHI